MVIAMESTNIIGHAAFGNGKTKTSTTIGRQPMHTTQLGAQSSWVAAAPNLKPGWRIALALPRRQSYARRYSGRRNASGNLYTKKKKYTQDLSSGPIFASTATTKAV